MIRVLAYDSNRNDRLRLLWAIKAVMKRWGWSSFSVTRSFTPADMVASVKAMRRGFFDIAVCWLDDEPDSVFDALGEIRSVEPDAQIVIVAEDADCASRAVQVEASGYCLVRQGIDGLMQALSPAVSQAVERHSKAMGLRSSTGVCNVVLDDFLFAESSKKGAIIHMSDGETILVRTALQALFERLSADKRFVKAGSSFIVNLDSICSFGERAAIFHNGESVVLPVRVHKPVKEAFESFCRR